MNNVRKIFAIAGFFVVATAPLAAKASLVPCGRAGQPMCTLCDIFVGIHGIMDFILKLAFLLGFAALAAAAVMYVVSIGSPGVTTSAKNIMKNAIIGIIVILGAWLFVNTTMVVLGKKADLGIGVIKWDTFTCNK